MPAVPIQMVIIDRQTALLPVQPDAPRTGALEVRSPGIVAALHTLFEQVWENGLPFGKQIPRDHTGCTPAEKELLQGAATGDTDETPARRLGVSLRTRRRMMPQLMERLNATSRSQPGVNTTKHGWP
ncbi:LuxR family transcriptional regulator [Streptomyces cyaneofuscatus]|uniref:LuxR family transcriptional regulator n=1 Tax=Streptomyces cyaneofuscatus TaxID=66883 RepID=UPI002D789FA2|nr:LuxR family transcriptional regulator [Streptomyces cyaneofuscatus]WRO14573.1 LuxR family transcriptional regulator [Streptomyces cyaneofuscatus]